MTIDDYHDDGGDYHDDGGDDHDDGGDDHDDGGTIMMITTRCQR